MERTILLSCLLMGMFGIAHGQRNSVITSDKTLVLKNEEATLEGIYNIEVIESSLTYEKCKPSDVFPSAVTKEVFAYYHYLVPYENSDIVVNTLEPGNTIITDDLVLKPQKAGKYTFYEGYELVTTTKTACGIINETREFFVIGSFEIEVVDFSLLESEQDVCALGSTQLSLSDYYQPGSIAGIEIKSEGDFMIGADQVNLETMDYGTHVYEITATGFYNGEKKLEFLLHKEKLEIVAPGPNQEVCQGEVLELTGGSPKGGEWSSNDLEIENANKVQTKSIPPGTYSVFYTFKEGVCETIKEKQITILPPPKVNAGADITWCGKGQISLNSGSPSGGSWSSENEDITINENLALIGDINYEDNITMTFPLTYSYTNQNGCTYSDEIILTLYAEPEKPELSHQKICGFGQTTISIGNYDPRFDYTWYENNQKLIGEKGKSFTTGILSKNTTYQVVVENPLSVSCQQTGSKTIEIITPPAPPDADNLVICTSEKAILSATHTGAVTYFNWYDQQGNLLNDENDLGNTYTTATAISQDVSYFVTAIVNGCESEKREVKIYKINQPGKPEVKGMERCGPGELNYVITSNEGDSFHWYDQESGGELKFVGKNITPFLTKTATYFVSAVNQREIPGEGTFSCEGERTKVTGVVNGIPSPPAELEYVTCGVESVTLTGKGGIGDQYHWYNANDLLVGEGSTFKVGQVSKNEKFYYTTLSAEGCESEATTVIIKFQNPPDLPVVNDLEKCGSGPIEITPEGDENAIFRFYNENDRINPVHEGTSYKPEIKTTTTFYISQVVDNCESLQQRLDIQYFPQPTAPDVEDVAYCGQSDIHLIATGSGVGGEYKWYASKEGKAVLNTGNQFSYSNLQTTTSFYVSYTSLKGCESQRTKVTAYIHQIPETPEVEDEYSCNTSGGVVFYIQNPIPNYEYQWYTQQEELLKTGLTFQPPSITATTTYKIRTVSPNNCQSAFTIASAIILDDEPVEIGETLTLCKWEGGYNLNQGMNQSLKGGIFTGSGVFSDSLFVPSVVEPGEYEVQYTLRKGNCKVFGSRKIIVSAGTGESGLSLANGVIQICENESPFSLDPFAYKNYSHSSTWSGEGVTSNIFDPSGLGSGIFTLDYSVEVEGCEYQTKQQVEIIKSFASKPRVSTTFVEVCENEMVDLTASFSDANKTINWYNEQNEKIGEGTAISYRAEESGLLYAKGVDQKGCESSPTIINLNVYTFPDSIQSSATQVKAHEAINFDVAEPAENDNSYSWDFGDGQSSKQKSPAIFYYDEGEFNVELIISNLKKGCYDTLYKTITVNGIAGNDSTITSISPKVLPPELSIYPNPFHNRLKIKITDQSISQNPINSPSISVYDVLGRNFLRKEDVEITTEGIEINTRDFPSGIYLIKINTRIFKLSKS